MNEFDFDLKPIAIDYLYDGMIADDDIYNYNGSVIVFDKGIVIRRAEIKKIMKVNDNYRNVSVFDSTYNKLIKKGFPAQKPLAHEILEEKIGYLDIKEEAEVFFAEIKRKKIVSKESADYITKKMLKALNEFKPAMIFQCINKPKPINEYLCRHSINVGFINGLMGKWLRLSDNDIELLVLAGLVHDVGKTRIPPEISDVPRKLTISEYEVVKMHPVYSYEMLCKDDKFPEVVKFTARHHHEKMNSSGYPDGIGVANISLFAKITAVADIYDAMVSKRSYREADNPFIIISNLSNIKFSELDMYLVKLFTEYFPSEFVGKPILLSDGSIGTIKFIVSNDLEHPIVDVNGTVKKMDDNLYCISLIFDE